ncbi:MAG: MOSC domain-containing protein [Pseudomonadota bacterium]
MVCMGPVSDMREMMARHAKWGRIEWIGLRPARREAMVAVPSVRIGSDGIEGDRSRGGKRAVTLIQAEHLPVVAALSDRAVSPEMLRRNLVVSGINLLALKGRQVRVGEAVLEVTGPCHPCSRMEEVLGAGGYTAVRGHGGVCARVIRPGEVRLGDALEA